MSGPATLPLLSLERVSKAYRGVKALSGVSVAVPEGELTVLLGAAGAGKTTTLRIIAGLEAQDEGRVLLAGHDVGRLEPRERDVAMIFDNLALYPDRSGFENIASPLRIRRRPSDEVMRRVDDVAKVLRITHLLQRLPRTMSGGERQRVALGRALVRKPRLFLLDEPLSSLDAMLRLELRAELRRMQRELGYTFVLATPDYAEALALADKVVMLRAGQVVQTGPAQVLYDDPADREVARFLGAPEINLLPAELLAPTSDHPRGALRIAQSTVGLGVPPPLSAAANGRVVEVGIRPERLRLVANGSVPFSASVVDVEPLGMASTVTVAGANAQLRIVMDAHQSRHLSLGERVGVDFRAADPLYFNQVTGLRLR